MSKVYCKSDFDKLEKKFKTERLQQQVKMMDIAAENALSEKAGAKKNYLLAAVKEIFRK